MWTCREGLEPMPHIGPGPLTDAEYETAEAAYMAAHYGGAVPQGAQRPRDAVYVHTDDRAPRGAMTAPTEAPNEEPN